MKTPIERITEYINDSENSERNIRDVLQELRARILQDIYNIKGRSKVREETRKSDLGVINKIAPYKRKYECPEDCRMGKCPGHEATFEYYSVSKTFKITFWDGKSIHHFDSVELGMIKDFISMLEEQ